MWTGVDPPFWVIAQVKHFILILLWSLSTSMIHRRWWNENRSCWHVRKKLSRKETSYLIVKSSLFSCLTFLAEQERNIAIELEQKMMEDFEWKLREVEGGYKTKIKTLEEGLESKVTFLQQKVSERFTFLCAADIIYSTELTKI